MFNDKAGPHLQTLDKAGKACQEQITAWIKSKLFTVGLIKCSTLFDQHIFCF